MVTGHLTAFVNGFALFSPYYKHIQINVALMQRLEVVTCFGGTYMWLGGVCWRYLSFPPIFLTSNFLGNNGRDNGEGAIIEEDC